MKQVRFEESEVPYQTLARFGLTQEKIEDLPLWALEDIGQGRRSPLLPIQVTNEEGETLKSRTRFALVRMEDGKVDVVFYPQLYSILFFYSCQDIVQVKSCAIHSFCYNSQRHSHKIPILGLRSAELVLAT